MYVDTYDRVSTVEDCGLEQNKCCMQQFLDPSQQISTDTSCLKVFIYMYKNEVRTFLNPSGIEYAQL